MISIKFFRTLITILVFCIRCVGGGINLKQAGQGLLRTGLKTSLGYMVQKDFEDFV